MGLIVLLAAMAIGPARMAGAQESEAEAGAGAEAAPAEVEAAPEAAPEPPAPPEPLPRDGQAYTVTAFQPLYISPSEALPTVDELMGVEVTLGRTTRGFIGPRAGVPTVTFRLSDVPQLDEHRFYNTAILAVNRAVLGRLNTAGIIGVLVSPHEDDIDPDTFEDLRPEGQTTLRLQIQVGRITRMRTIAAGNRVPLEERKNHPLHAEIIEDAPVAADDPSRPDIIRKDLLDRYLFWLNRHPRRRVDVAVAAAEEPGGIVLDFLVNESKPWLLYYQYSNTGTEATDEWRHRFGFVHTQLTNNDDILTLDYITTTDFDEVHGVVGTYEAPLLEAERLRWRAQGSWSRFDASEVGIGDEEFEGEDWDIGGELIYNLFQWNEMFLDVTAGARWQNVQIENTTFAPAFTIEGDEDFFLPHVGLRLERLTDVATTRGLVQLEWNQADFANTEPDDALGRIDPEDDEVVLRWDFTHSMYLEPLLNRAAWEDVSTPESSTLAHELALMLRGQYGFGDRLIPRHQDVVGGLYTVRGYPESVVAGDTTVVGSVEYRFHLPRVFTVQPDPSQTPLFGEPFRMSPQQVYGGADWDLIFRTFVDAGFSRDHQALTPTEGDETLVGAGAGVEFVFKQNLSARVDWAVALHDVDGSENVTEGSNRFHFVFTLFY